MTAARRRRSASLSAVALALSVLLAPPAHADEPATRERAAAYYREGNEAFSDKRWSDAERAYRKAWELGRSFDVAGNYGEVEVRLGKYAEAAMLLSYNLRVAPPSVKPAQIERTRHFLAEAKKHVGSVRVTVDVAGVRLLVDGKPIEAQDAAYPIFVEPGERLIEARLAGYAPARARVDVAIGEEEEVSLALERGRGPLFAFGAATLALAGLGAGFLVAAGDKASEADGMLEDLRKQKGTDVVCPRENATGDCAEIKSLRESHDTFVDVGTGALVAGGVALAAGIAYVVWPKPAADPKTGSLVIAPSLGPRETGVWVSGSF
jgi:tetratricopeptide (TPR) repeat protein